MMNSRRKGRGTEMIADNDDSKKISRNAPCPCGSGKKYKKCCGADAVAIERKREAQCDPNWAPEGVEVVADDTKGGWFNRHPKWTMKLLIAKDGKAEEDADHVINCLLRPYYERFCADFMRDRQGDVVILQNSQMHDERTVGQCPSIVIARHAEIWDVYKKKLDEFFKYFSDSDYVCEVRYDQSCGGPILTLIDEEGDVEMFFLGFPDRFGQ